MILLPAKQIFIIVPIHSLENGKNKMFNLHVDNKVQEIIRDENYATNKNEKCVHVSTNRISSSYKCKKSKASCHVIDIPVKEQKPTRTVFGKDGTHCFAKKTTRDYEKEKPSPFLKNIFRQTQSTTTKPEPEKEKITKYMA